MPLNVKLLRKVQRAIRKEPLRLRMDDWIVIKGHSESYFAHTGEFPACGTVACIAGWSCILHSEGREKELDPEESPASVKRRAKKRADAPVDIPSWAGDLLGLDSWSQADELFYVSMWPEEFRLAHAKASSRRERAAVTVKYIDHFIKVYGEPRKGHKKEAS